MLNFLIVININTIKLLTLDLNSFYDGIADLRLILCLKNAYTEIQLICNSTKKVL